MEAKLGGEGAISGLSVKWEITFRKGVEDGARSALRGHCSRAIRTFCPGEIESFAGSWEWYQDAPSRRNPRTA